MNRSLLKQPSALLPLIMSGVALGIVLGHAAVFGIVHEADEGTPAHLFQLLIVAQLPFIAFFAMKWLPQAPRQAMEVLMLQLAAVVVAFAAVYFLT